MIARKAFAYSFILNAPFWAMYNLLPFILYKELHASSYQVTLLIALKPIVSLFSIYWSSYTHNRPDALVKNVVSSTVLSHLPFFCLPFYHPPWFVITISAVYMMLERGAKPAWMELLKQHVPERKREKLFSWVSTTSYLAAGLLPPLFGFWMDAMPNVWSWIFPIVSLLALLPVGFQIQMRGGKRSAKRAISLKNPWVESYRLLKTNTLFTFFQIAFFLGGAGIMMMQPALPAFFMDKLSLNYGEIALALTMFKGIGFALTSRFWAHKLPKSSIFYLSGWVTLIMALSACILMAAPFWHYFVFVSYLFYGIMQAGSELIWHLSGPIFSKEEDSSLYTSVNIVLVGVRGLFAPFLGMWFMQFETILPMIVGTVFCLVSTFLMWRPLPKFFALKEVRVLAK